MLSWRWRKKSRNSLSRISALGVDGGARGWIGDNPFIYLDTKKVRSLGWEPKATIQDGVEKTVEYLLANPWVFEARD